MKLRNISRRLCEEICNEGEAHTLGIPGLDNRLTDGDEVVGLTRRPRFNP
jgi:hypothetical protein